MTPRSFFFKLSGWPRALTYHSWIMTGLPNSRNFLIIFKHFITSVCVLWLPIDDEIDHPRFELIPKRFKESTQWALNEKKLIGRYRAKSVSCSIVCKTECVNHRGRVKQFEIFSQRERELVCWPILRMRRSHCGTQTAKKKTNYFSFAHL